MREILFRGKRVDNGEWVYGSLIVAGEYCCILQPEDKVHPMDYPYLDRDIGTIDGYATPVIPETVGQYTGFKDRNDKKIFEGDIVRLMFGTREIKDIYTVSFVNDRGGWFPFANGDGCGCCEDATYPPSDEGVCYDFIVIGNMHDDPELLGVCNG